MGKDLKREQPVTGSGPRPVVLIQGQGYRRLIEGCLAETRKLNWQLMEFDLVWKNVPTNPPPIGAIVWRGSEVDLFLRGVPFPVIQLGAYKRPSQSSDEQPHIAYDVEKAGTLAADHFCDRRFRNLAFVRFHGGGREDIFVRAFGARAEARGCQCHGHDLRQSNNPDFTKEITKRMRAWILDLPKPLGVVLFDDQLAVQVLHVCRMAGLRVPEDVAVLGRTNHPYYSEIAPVPLSSIDPDTAGMGRKAIQLLKDLVDGMRLPKKPILIEPKTVLRQSTDVLAVSDKRVSSALRFMYDSISCPMTIDDVAAEVGCSRRTLERAFKHALGWGINAELRRKRFEITTNFLRSTDMTIAQIASAVGLATPEYLHRIFKQEYGVTPQEFRQAEQD